MMSKDEIALYVVERIEAGLSREDVSLEVISYNYNLKQVCKVLAAYDKAVANGTVPLTTPPEAESNSGWEGFGQFIGAMFYALFKVVGWVFSLLFALVMGWIITDYVNQAHKKFWDND